MSVTGDIYEVKVPARGSQLVGVHTASATSITVANPTDFDTSGGTLLLDGVVYAWTSVTVNGTDDDATGTLAITPALSGADKPDTLPVELWSGAQVIKDVVLMVDSGGETPAAVTLKYWQRKDWSALEGILEPPVPATFSDDFDELLDADGYTPTLDASNAQGLPDAPTVAVAAPTTTPSLLVTGFPTSLLAAVTNYPDVPSRVQFAISTSNAAPPVASDYSGTATPQFAAQITNLPDGTVLGLTTTYYVAAAFTNSAGTGPWSAWVQTSLDPAGIQRIVTLQLIAGFVLANRIQVGLAYIDAIEGFVLPNPDGTQTKFPVNGVDPMQLAAYVIALAMTVKNGMQVSGTSTFSGPIVLGNGVTDPTVQPTFSRYWPTLALQGAGFDRLRGLVDGGAAGWITAYSFGSMYIGKYGKTGSGAPGVLTGTLVSGTSGYVPTGVTKLGSFLYTLGYDLNRANRWFVKKLDGTTFAEQAGTEWEFTGDPTSTTAPTIGNDGTYLVIARANAAGSAYNVRTFTTSGSATALGLTATTVVNTGIGSLDDLSGVYIGSADYGAVRVVLSLSSGAVRAFNIAGARQTAAEFISAGNAKIAGLVWDGAGFHHLDPSGFVWDYTTDNPADTTPDIAYSWYDADVSSGSVVHETRATSSKVTITRKARSGLTISTPTPPDASNTDPTQRDKANLVRIYASPTAGGTLRLQASPALGTYAASLTSIATGSATAQTSNGFVGVAGSAGSLVSTALDGSSNPLTKFDGAGAARAAKLIQSGTKSVSVTTGGTAASASVTFPVAFETAPVVAVAADTASPGTTMASKQNVTTTGFTVWAVRSSTGTVNVDWIATTGV